MGTIVGVTGTPGTGKKSIAPLLAAALGVRSLLLPTAPARPSASNKGRGREVDLPKAKERISKDPPGEVVAYGHLLPYVLPKAMVRKVVVLRCEPLVLRARLSRRGYSPVKTRENVEAELIGLIANDAYGAFGHERTVEFDTTISTPQGAARAIVDLVQGKKARPKRYDWIPSYRTPGALTSLLYPDTKARG